MKNVKLRNTREPNYAARTLGACFMLYEPMPVAAVKSADHLKMFLVETDE